MSPSRDTCSSRCRLLTEVSQFQFSQVTDEQVLRLQVSVEDPVLVDEAEASQQLEHEDLHRRQQLVSQRRLWRQLVSQLIHLNTKMTTLIKTLLQTY